MEKNNFGGFTLIELVVVLVIVGIISSLAIPRMINSITHVDLKNAARRTVVFLNKAREEAYYKRKETWVFFDSDNKKMAVLENDPSEQGEVRAIPGLAYNFPAGINIRMENAGNQEEDAQLLFSSVGSSSGGTVILRNQQKREYRIEVDILTGFAQIVN